MFFRKNYKKIFVISCVLLENNKIKITYLLDNYIDFDIYRGFFEKTIITENKENYKNLKMGKWIRVELDYVGNIVYIYNK